MERCPDMPMRFVAGPSRILGTRGGSIAPVEVVRDHVAYRLTRDHDAADLVTGK